MASRGHDSTSGSMLRGSNVSSHVTTNRRCGAYGWTGERKSATRGARDANSPRRTGIRSRAFLGVESRANLPNGLRRRLGDQEHCAGDDQRGPGQAKQRETPWDSPRGTNRFHTTDMVTAQPKSIAHRVICLLTEASDQRALRKSPR